jgi:hypothetical protein
MAKRTPLTTAMLLVVLATACDKAPTSSDGTSAEALLRAKHPHIAPENLSALLSRGYRGPRAALSARAAAVAADDHAIIDNGTIQLGILAEGHLNVEGEASAGGTSFVGLRYLPTNNEATAPGCLCEGWGVADAESPSFTAYANENFGKSGLTVESFTSTASRATSVVTAGEGSKQVRVTHEFSPASETENLYRVVVTIENIDSAAIEDLRYRRTFDWDVEPTAFDEFVTIQGTAAAADILKVTDNGIQTSDPLQPATKNEREGDFVDAGPDDLGSNFDFGFGRLNPGATKTFTIFYGAAGTETGALNALKAVGAEVYSLGQPNTDDGKTEGRPNTFIFGFKGVGGVALNNPPVPTIDGPSEGDVGAELSFTTGATDPENDTPLVCEIQFGAGAPFTELSSCSAGASHAFDAAGEYVITLRARDPFGATGTVTKTVTIAGETGNRPPVPTIDGPETGDVGSAISFTTGATDPDGDSPLACEINYGDGGGFVALPSCGAGASHTYSSAGSYTVTIRATDPDGAAGTATHTVTVGDDEPPPAECSEGTGVAPTLTLIRAYARTEVGPFPDRIPNVEMLRFGFADPDCGPWRARIDWGDGTVDEFTLDGGVTPPADNYVAYHDYASPGSYTVRMTLTDAAGLGSGEQSIAITAAASVAAAP